VERLSPRRRGLIRPVVIARSQLPRAGSSLADIGATLDFGFQFASFTLLGPGDQMPMLPKNALCLQLPRLMQRAEQSGEKPSSLRYAIGEDRGEESIPVAG
jgi:hypothetical protein